MSDLTRDDAFALRQAGAAFVRHASDPWATAHWLGSTTPRLVSLRKRGLVESKRHRSWLVWRITEAGATALAAHDKNLPF